MSIKRIISSLLIISLLWAFIPLRVDAAHCHGGDQETPVAGAHQHDGGGAHSHHHHHGGHRHDAHHHHHGEITHGGSLDHVAEEAESQPQAVWPPLDEQSRLVANIAVDVLPEHAICCGNNAGVIAPAVAAATVTSSSSWTLMLMAFVIVKLVVPSLSLELHRDAACKVDSSPPCMAVKTRHTYLHISVFLI